jgi:hypothetical protein
MKIKEERRRRDRSKGRKERITQECRKKRGKRKER